MQNGSLLGGVIEGFYGLPWTPKQRVRLFGWMRRSGLNTYMYGPKDDPHHRVRWRENYAGPLLEEVTALLRDCQEHGLQFLYAVGPGLDLRYADSAEVEALIRRFDQLCALGGRNFAVLFDDIPVRMAEKDAARFASFAEAQAHVANAVLAGLRQRFPDVRLFFCPTEYCARMAKPSVATSPYLKELGAKLDPAIEIFWTGPEIISEAISVTSIRELATVLRRPPVIWDNLHANDYDMRRVFLGPYDGRPETLRGEIRGILTNPNCQFEANFVAIHSLGAWLGRHTSWEPRRAFLQAISDWLPEFSTGSAAPITLRDLQLLGDLYYLPLQHGELARQFLTDLSFLLREPPSHWQEVGDRVARQMEEMVALYDKLTALVNRDLLHALYRYLWEMKEEVLLVQAYLAWRRDHPDDTAGFRAPEFRPGLFRGGFTADLQKLLPMDEAGVFRPAPGTRA